MPKEKASTRADEEKKAIRTTSETRLMFLNVLSISSLDYTIIIKSVV